MLVPHVKPAVLSKDLHGAFKRSILTKYFNQNYYWTGSGSSAIYLAIKAISAKNVAVPAFTCSIVEDAVRKSGAKIQFYDTGIITTLTDIRKAISKKPDLLILSYNFGLIPDNLKKILSECRKNKIIVLEDCAHAFSFGQNANITIYSAGIAKSLSYYGGFLLSKKKLTIEKFDSLSTKKELMFFVKAILSKLFFNKYIYSFLNIMIINQIDMHPKAKLYSISNFAKKVVLRQINRFKRIQKIRNKNFKLAKNLKYVIDTEQKSNLYIVFQMKDRKKIIEQLKRKNIEIMPTKSFRNIGGKKYKKAERAEKEHLVFSLYRSKKEMEMFISAYNKIN
jgi:dTDP-4-amino-4,6-dideoxygalactose transaminase